VSFVLDASIAVAWLLDDENEPRAEASLERLGIEIALVPVVWHVEVHNALLSAERRRRLRPEEVNARLRQIDRLPLRTDSSPSFEAAFMLARTHRLSVYDALYLELALRANAALATLDNALAAAARAEEHPLL